ncbi:MAG: hypothetical protein IJZ40_00660 [Bacteroidaceae bacterium]|nr:hypothetical protein [Bacteroidaceae bacterium]
MKCPNFIEIRLKYENHSFSAQYGLVNSQVLISFPVIDTDEKAQQICKKLSVSRGQEIVVQINDIPMCGKIATCSFTWNEQKNAFRDFNIIFYNKFVIVE